MSSPAHRVESDRLLLGLGLVAIAAVLAVFAWPMLDGRVYTLSDLGNYTLIGRDFYRNSLVSGDEFLWWPNLEGGVYLHGLGQLGLYHPVNLLLYRILPLPWSFGVEIFLSYPLLLIGAAWLLRRWQLSRVSALFGGAMLAFSGFALLHHVHPNVMGVAAHIPWLLVMLDITLRDESPRRRILALAGVTALTASQLLLHFPQVVVMSSQVELAYVIALGVARGRLWSSAPGLLCAKGLAILIGALQLLPSWDYLQYTMRADASLDFRYSLSLPPLNLLQLVAPYLSTQRYWPGTGEVANAHEFGVYDGAVSLALLCWLVMRWRHLGALRPLLLGLLALLLVGLDLSLGRHGLLYHLQVRVPLVGLFRAPCRNILLVHLALAGLGALAFEDLRQRLRLGQRTAWRSLWPLALAPLLAVALAVWATGVRLGETTAPGSFAMSLAAPGWIWLGAGLAVAAALAVCLAARGAHWALAALFLLAAADQGYYGLSYAHSESPVPFAEFRRAPATFPPSDATHRIHGGVTRFSEKTPNIFALWGYRVINGYTGARTRRYLDYTDTQALRLGAVQWFYRNDLDPPRLQPVPDPMPRIRMVSRMVASRTPRATLPEIDIATTAIAPRPLGLEAALAGSARFLADRPGRIAVATQSSSRQLLILSERHMSGWTVRVDGFQAELIPVYGDFMGCVVGAGSHRVEFHFEPGSLRAGRIAALLGLFGSFALYGGLLLRQQFIRNRGGGAAD